MFLHSVVNSEKESMHYKFFKAQWEFPTRGDWSEQCKQDLEDFNIPTSLSYFEGKSQNMMKTLVNKKRREYGLKKFLTMKSPHSKMDNLIYNDLKLQNYLKCDELTVEESKIILTWRLRMARFGKNYGEILKPCPLCKFHIDSQEKCYQECMEIKKYVDTKCNYADLFYNPSKKLAQELKSIMKIREGLIE